MIIPEGHPALAGTILTMEQQTLKMLLEIKQIQEKQLAVLEQLNARRPQQQDQKRK
jgi:hypothetical protein